MKFCGILRICLLLLWGTFHSGAFQIASSQQVHTYVDADSVEVGQIIHYSIVLESNSDEAVYPDGTEFEDPLEFISRQRFQVTATRDSLVYRMQFFGTDNYTIPRLDIYLPEQDTLMTTSLVPLYFRTLVSDPAEEEFKALKPIFEFTRNWWPLLLALLLLLAASWYGYRAYKRHQERRDAAPPEVRPEPFVSPLDTLRNTLKTMPRPSALQQRQEFEEYYVTLGDAIRRYLKQVYEFQALEMTTREIIESLRRDLASQEIITITRKVLNEADMVKFANFTPDQGMALSVYQRAEQFAQTAAVVNAEQIRYLKYRYEVKNGLIKKTEILQSSEKGRKE